MAQYSSNRINELEVRVPTTRRVYLFSLHGDWGFVVHHLCVKTKLTLVLTRRRLLAVSMCWHAV